MVERQIPSTVLELEERAERDAELVAGAAAVGREPEAVGQPLALEQAEHRLRVADVDREQHRRDPSGPARDRGRRPVEQYVYASG